jgi:sodium/hydrogen exchanger 8
MSLMIACPWLAYLISEGLELSGIVAILVNGVVLQIYANPNVSPPTKKILQTIWQTLSSSFDVIVFLFLGIGLTAFDHPYAVMGWGLILTTIVNLNLARGINVLVISWCVNRSRRKHRIGCKMQTVMWVAGLRGAMAYALALKCVEPFSDTGMGSVILLVTLLYAFMTILGVGSVLHPILTWADVKRKEIDPDVEVEFYESQQGCCLRLKTRMEKFDHDYFKALFVV